MAGSASAQILIQPGTPEERNFVEAFDKLLADTAAPKLQCNITRVPPRLSFSFRYWAGYEITVPVRQYQPASKGQLTVAIRAVPRGGTPRYFIRRRPLPPLPEDPKLYRRAELYLSGALVLGPGEYEMDLQMADSTGRVCRDAWTLKVPSSKTPLRIEPGEVTDSRIDQWDGIPEKQHEGTVTVFLHAAPVFPRRNVTRISAWDTAVLLGSLTSLLDTLPFREARVVAYNLDSRRVIFEDGKFGPRGLSRLGTEMETLDLGTISVDTLQSAGPLDLVHNMVDAELRRANPSDAVVFLGPLSRYFGKIPDELKQLRRQLPDTFGLSIFPRFGQTGDLIDSFVKSGGGDVVVVYRPSDLAKAIRQIERTSGN